MESDSPSFLPKRKKVAHYHGDGVQILFVAAGILTFVAIPLWGDILPFGLMFQIGSGLLLVLLAGITNPRSMWILVVDALVACAGAFVLEIAAITYYETQPFMLFIVREATVIMLLIAFYYSVKSIRAMWLGTVGKPEIPGEFDRRDELDKA